MSQSFETTDVNEVTGNIVDSCLKVHKALGPGLYERVYEECLCYELQKKEIPCERQKVLSIEYEEMVIDNAFKLDMLVDNRVIVELKSVDMLMPIHESQILTYMKLTGVEIGLLINFNVPLIKNGIRRFKL